MSQDKLKNKIEKLEKELDIVKDKLYKLTPNKPIINDDCKYDSAKKELVHKYTYYCSYCGEQVRANSKKHKCGQIQDWSFMSL